MVHQVGKAAGGRRIELDQVEIGIGRIERQHVAAALRRVAPRQKAQFGRGALEGHIAADQVVVADTRVANAGDPRRSGRGGHRIHHARVGRLDERFGRNGRKRRQGRKCGTQTHPGPCAFHRPALVPRPRAHHAVGVAAVGGRDRGQRTRGGVEPPGNRAAIDVKRHLERIARLDRQIGDVMGGEVRERERVVRRVELDEIEVGVRRVQRQHIAVCAGDVAPRRRIPVRCSCCCTSRCP